MVMLFMAEHMGKDPFHLCDNHDMKGSGLWWGGRRTEEQGGRNVFLCSVMQTHPLLFQIKQGFNEYFYWCWFILSGTKKPCSKTKLWSQKAYFMEKKPESQKSQQ